MPEDPGVCLRVCEKIVASQSLRALMILLEDALFCHGDIEWEADERLLWYLWWCFSLNEHGWPLTVSDT